MEPSLGSDSPKDPGDSADSPLGCLRFADLGGGTNIAVRMRLGVALLVAAVVCATAGTARAGTELIVTGHGWGHGVGMSQWGAYGYALHGWKYRRILAHYYPGTKMGHVGEYHVRVLLTQGTASVTVGCATQIKVTDGRRLTRMLKPGTYGVGPRLVLPVRKNGAGMSFGHLAVLDCARAPLTFDGREYHGTLVLRSQGGGVSVVNGLALDTYLRGVVPSESPSHWPHRRARGAGGRRSLVRHRGAEAELLVRPRADHGRPGLRRGQSRDAALRRGGVQDARPGPDVGRPGRADVLLLELGRPDRGRAGRLARRGADPVPALGAGSVRQLLAAPQLGPVQLHLVAPGGAPRPRQPGRVGARPGERQLPRRAGRLPPRFRCGHQPQRRRGRRGRSHLLSTWFSIGQLSLVDEQHPRAVREPGDGLCARGET